MAVSKRIGLWAIVVLMSVALGGCTLTSPRQWRIFRRQTPEQKREAEAKKTKEVESVKKADTEKPKPSQKSWFARLSPRNWRIFKRATPEERKAKEEKDALERRQKQKKKDIEARKRVREKELAAFREKKEKEMKERKRAQAKAELKSDIRNIKYALSQDKYFLRRDWFRFWMLDRPTMLTPYGN